MFIKTPVVKELTGNVNPNRCKRTNTAVHPTTDAGTCLQPIHRTLQGIRRIEVT